MDIHLTTIELSDSHFRYNDGLEIQPGLRRRNTSTETLREEIFLDDHDFRALQSPLEEDLHENEDHEYENEMEVPYHDPRS